MKISGYILCRHTNILIDIDKTISVSSELEEQHLIRTSLIESSNKIAMNIPKGTRIRKFKCE